MRGPAGGGGGAERVAPDESSDILGLVVVAVSVVETAAEGVAVACRARIKATRTVFQDIVIIMQANVSHARGSCVVVLEAGGGLGTLVILEPFGTMA